MTGAKRLAAGVLVLAGWVIVIPLAVVALARLVAWDARTSLVELNALTPVLFLPAWPVAVLAGALRRWALVAASAVVVVAHIGLALPEVRAGEAIPAAARSAPHFRVLDANVYAPNRDTVAFAAEIRRHRPDVLILQEATPTFVADLDATGATADLPFRITVPRDDPFAAVVASRWPVTEDDIVASHGRPILIRATVEVEGRAVRLFAVHTVAPTGGARVAWIEDLEVLRSAVAAEDRPVLVAGDFNATWGHRHFRSLLSIGLTDAAAACGKPYQMTWPRDLPVVPPLLRIDHILTTRGLVVTRIHAGAGTGSDHRPLVADVSVL